MMASTPPAPGPVGAPHLMGPFKHMLPLLLLGLLLPPAARARDSPAATAAGELTAGFSAAGSLCLESLKAYGVELLAAPSPLWQLTATLCGGPVFPAGVAVDGCTGACAGAAQQRSGAGGAGLELRWWGCPLPAPVGGTANVSVQLAAVAAAPGEDGLGGSGGGFSITASAVLASAPTSGTATSDSSGGRAVCLQSLTVPDLRTIAHGAEDTIFTP